MFHGETRFARAPAEVWPILSDTNRRNEVVQGIEAFTVEAEPAPDGSVRRHARGRLGPLRVEWEEGFGEWVENRYWRQVRHYTTGPLRSLSGEMRLVADNGGTRVQYHYEVSWDSLLGGLIVRLGGLERVANEIVETAEAMIAALDDVAAAPVSKTVPTLDDAQRARLETCIAEIADEGGLAHRLGEFLMTASAVDLKRMRPLALAREWGVPAAAVVDLCLAAKSAGLLTLHWGILCPRCRGAKAEVTNLYELPKGVHCESCNIDYERDFAANVELLFTPAGWLRELPEGEFCMMGAASTPHVKVQRLVEPGGMLSEELALPAGGYRLRTVEAGGQSDVECDGVRFPEIVARSESVDAGAAAAPGHIVLRNESARPLHLVVEEREWTADALTGPQVIAMPAFRELCPEQVLRPGDDVTIGQVSILFSDLKGSTALYAEIGDGTAYGLVRDHFAFMAERIRGHRDVLVKTMGDAVMAAFAEPADALATALSVQRDVATFNAEHGPAALVVKFGMHRGECIAVNTAGVLDYFGTTVNIAARLQEESLGGDIVLSDDIMADSATAEALSASYHSQQFSYILIEYININMLEIYIVLDRPSPFLYVPIK